MSTEPLFRQEERDLRRIGLRAKTRRREHHAREARRQGQRPDRTALVRDRAVTIERAKRYEQGLCLLPGRRGRRIEPGETGALANAPFGKVEDETAQIGG